MLKPTALLSVQHCWLSLCQPSWQICMSCCLRNPYREIGSRYPSMSMIVIGLSLPILRCSLITCFGCCIMGSKYLEYISMIRTENTQNNSNNKRTESNKKALNRINTELNKSRTIKTGNDNTRHCRFKRSWIVIVQYLLGINIFCDYSTDNCNPICLNVIYKKSNFLMRASLPSQQAHK